MQKQIRDNATLVPPKGNDSHSEREWLKAIVDYAKKIREETGMQRFSVHIGGEAIGMARAGLLVAEGSVRGFIHARIQVANSEFHIAKLSCGWTKHGEPYCPARPDMSIWIWYNWCQVDYTKQVLEKLTCTEK